MKTSTQLWLVMAALSPLGLSCNTLECGEGTIEEDGVCIGTTGSGDPVCGPGTIFNSTTGECTPDYCGDGTANPDCGFCPNGAEPLPNPLTGVIECIGGEGGACSDDQIACPTPDPGKVMACGAIYDMETTAPLESGAGLKVEFYDALKFATMSPPPPPLGSGEIDDCGHFNAVGATAGVTPATFIAVAIDDAEGSPDDDYVLTGVGAPGTAGKVIVNAYATRRLTVEKWETATGVDDLEGRGVFLPIYLSKDNPPLIPGFKSNGELAGPVAGVTVSGAPGQAFYFADTDAAQRALPNDTLDVTGVSGAVLLLDAAIDEYSGTGPDGCTWSTALGGTVSGVIFVAERHHIGTGSEECN